MSPDELPAIFTHGWSLPKPDPFLAFFRPHIHPDATFIQPMFPDAHGITEIERMFSRLFTLLPDMSAQPRHHAVHDDVVFIESDCTATLGRRTVAFAVCDRFTLAEGHISERRSFSDPLGVIGATLRTPSSWPRALRRSAK